MAAQQRAEAAVTPPFYVYFSLHYHPVVLVLAGSIVSWQCPDYVCSSQGSSMRAHPHGLYPGAYGSQPVYSGYGYGPPAMPIVHAHAASFGLAAPAVQAGAPPAVHAGAAAYAMANPAAHQAAKLAAMHADAMSVAGMPPGCLCARSTAGLWSVLYFALRLSAVCTSAFS